MRRALCPAVRTARGIAEDKREKVGAVLGDAFLRHCRNGDCSRQAASRAGSREALLVEQQFCEVCGGSTNRRALERMAAAMQAAGTSRVLVVGGTKEMEREIRNNTPALVEWRFENGLTSRDDRYYRADMQWGGAHSHLVQHAVASQGVEALWRQGGQPQDDGDAAGRRRPCRPGEAAPGAVERAGAD